jgi:delta 1-pyrroline-5-carboxylate dehydrogenase
MPPCSRQCLSKQLDKWVASRLSATQDQLLVHLTSEKDIVCLQAFDHGPWPRMTGRERGAILYKFADLMEQNTHELAILESLDNGKPLSASK